MSLFHSRRFQEIASGVVVLAVFVLPVFVWASDTKKVYVDAQASGTQDGSVNHPYKTIAEGLNHAGDADEVHVAVGTYHENIEIPDGVKLYGADESKTIIDAKSNDKPAVSMNHKTTLDKFTVKGGSHGVYVGKDSKASIIECIVEDSDKDGIHVREANTSDKYKVSIVKSEVRNSNRTGIFAETRNVVIMETVVRDNESDGVDLAPSSKAWIDNNNFRDNNGSGLKVILDNSNIFVTSKNTFRNNKHEGIEVNDFGKAGTMNIKKSKFINNNKYGIARIARNINVPMSVWKGLTETSNTFTSNNAGTVSPIVHLK